MKGLEESLIVKEIMDFIRKNDVKYYWELKKRAIENNLDDWILLLKGKNNYYFWKNYLESYRRKRKIKK